MTVASAPYPPSWLNRLVTAIDAFPGSAWIAYLAIAAAATIAMHLNPWSMGTSPVGTFDLANAYWGILPAAGSG